ncbi:MAG: hypothetical protein F2754_01030 [Actinobacteria bacterium]|uniref:Unannotated protein n=1 Tax=freshwater metagenome TaxID=449393 RepID=A0A6J6SBZ7_9ZZZZ|nr:hypothetical protein [Actinomycetota bacterium]MSW92402.1 hypothetical protein [Actinomycetota bacterium]MSX85952.1 hypothetical protein [Actinomycetota bacterium]MSY70944.1 hypothetical protein [Actinomycetota bacterium]
MRSTGGRLLLAGPSLRDPSFYRTVVLNTAFDALPEANRVLGDSNDWASSMGQLSLDPPIARV